MRVIRNLDGFLSDGSAEPSVNRCNGGSASSSSLATTAGGSFSAFSSSGFFSPAFSSAPFWSSFFLSSALSPAFLAAGGGGGLSLFQMRLLIVKTPTANTMNNRKRRSTEYSLRQ